ncbi:SNF2 family N-terminal domain containing protein [Elaphomyces granulatus]
MDIASIDERPAKKPRFFVEDEDDVPLENGNSPMQHSFDASAQSPHPELADKNSKWERNYTLKAEGHMQLATRETERAQEIEVGHSNTASTASLLETYQQKPEDSDGAFDISVFTSIVGQDVPDDMIIKIRDAAGNDLQRAINIFLDGSWKNSSNNVATVALAKPSNVEAMQGETSQVDEKIPLRFSPKKSTDRNPQAEVLESQPPLRYIGAFGVGAWATKSGHNLVRHGEIVRIERAISQPFTTKLGRGRRPMNQQDVLTRFINIRGEEVGRLPRETAEWVSTLLDQMICKFEGICVYAPDKVRVNDTIYLQLRCFLRHEAFRSTTLSFWDDNRSIGLFEQKESTEERKLRLRQTALIKLFDEINLLPTSSNELTAKHKKDGLLRLAEVAELPEKNKDKLKDAKEPSDSSDEDELEEDQLDMLYQKAQSFDFNTPESEPAETFTLELRKYQKQALHWMLAKEKDEKLDRNASMHPLWEEYKWPVKDVEDKMLPCVSRQDSFYVNSYSGELSLEFPAQQSHSLGGILADEMGLGKTIEMLSLMHSHRHTSDDQEMKDANDLCEVQKPHSKIASAHHTTLVVAPTSLLSQWQSEAAKASKDGSLNTLVYYGGDRCHLRNLCSPDNDTPTPHLIITSYGVVLSDFRSFASQPVSSAADDGGLFSMEFFRVILDEAHLIKNRRSKTARACYELRAMHRWVLTGTPIVNRLEDLFSLVRFLKAEPWSNFSFWKTFITVPFESKDYVRALNVVQTVLEPLVLRRTKTMKTPDGEALVPLPPRVITIEEVELSEQEREIYHYIYARAKRTFNDNVEAGTVLKSFSTIFAQILRLRQCCCHPVLTRKKAILAEEEDAASVADEANDLKDDMDLQELIDRFTSSTEGAGHNGLQDSALNFTTHALKQIQSESSGECPICAEEPMIDPAVTSCWHSACKKCLEDFVRHQTNQGVLPRCFSCREPVTRQDIFEVIRHPSSLDDDLCDGTLPSSSPTPRMSLRRIYPLSPSAHTSAKIHALISHLTRLSPDIKSVVFSQFTSFLDLISAQLNKAGIPHLRLDGTMQQRARAEVLASFNKTDDFEDELLEEEDISDRRTRRSRKAFSNSITNPNRSQSSPRVLLISLRAGGVGLNLTAASRVYMMDPWWSFAVEVQAIDRVHRMGQLRDVAVTRFIVKDSIEGRMLQVQERKMNIAGTLGLRVGGDGGEEERKKGRIEELKLLFE